MLSLRLINERCEFDVIAMLTSISLAQKIDHIQFQISFNQTNGRFLRRLEMVAVSKIGSRN